MIQDSDIEVLDNVYCIPINPELLVKEGFELKEQLPSIRDIHYIHKDLDIKLTQYDNQSNRVVAESGYSYCYTVKFELPIPNRNSSFSGGGGRQMSTFSYSIYTYGQLLAIMEAKRRLNALQESIERSVADIIIDVNKSNKYKK